MCVDCEVLWRHFSGAIFLVQAAAYMQQANNL